MGGLQFHSQRALNCQIVIVTFLAIISIPIVIPYSGIPILIPIPKLKIFGILEALMYYCMEKSEQGYFLSGAFKILVDRINIQ